MVARCRWPSTHDGKAVGGGDRQGRTALSGSQGVGLTTETFPTGFDDSCRVNLTGPAESQPGDIDHLFESSLTLSLWTLAKENDLALATYRRPGPEAGPKLRCRVVSRTHDGGCE